jgi:thymidylate kinase
MVETNVIIFCGLDGSGKTTQAKKLLIYLESKKISSKYVWLRYPNFFSLPIAGFLRLFGVSGYPIPEEKKSRGLNDLSTHKNLKKLWIWSLYNDFKFTCWKKISRPIKNRKILILDRFVIDTVVELAINTDQEDNFDDISKKFFKFIPDNSMIFFFDIDPKISYERNHEEDLIILQKKRKIYQKICKSLDISIIDGTKSIETIYNEILVNCKFVK